MKKKKQNKDKNGISWQYLGVQNTIKSQVHHIKTPLQ